MFSAAIKGNSTSSRCLPNQNTSESLGATELATNLLSGEDPAGAESTPDRFNISVIALGVNHSESGVREDSPEWAAVAERLLDLLVSSKSGSALLLISAKGNGFPGVWTAAGQRDYEQTPGEERAVKEVGSRQWPTGMFVYHDGADEAPSLDPTLAPQVWVGTRQNWQRAANRIGRAD
ncbi:hypothetical protein PAMP_016592 [Pampus punctatissimus]